MSGTAPVAYKVLTDEQAAAFTRDGVFDGSPVDKADGFIHMSAANQLDETVDRHFAGQHGLVVLTVNVAALGSSVKWEPSRGGALFPHLYASLPATAVLAHGPLLTDPEGKIIPPAAI